MRTLFFIFLSSLLLGLIAPVVTQAQSQRFDIRPQANQLVGEAITQTFSGTTFDGAYNFTRDGEPRAFYSEEHREDGTTVYSEGRIQAEGLWFVENDALCFSYDHPMLQGGCFRVYRISNCYYFYSTSVPRLPDELDRDYWVARATVDGEPPNCDPAMS